MKDVLLTEKQLDVLTFIDDWGVVTVEQIKRNCGITKGYVSKILKVLLDKQMIQRMSHGKRMYVYYITKQGSLYVGKIGMSCAYNDNEPNLLMLKHNLLMVDVCWYYQNFYIEKGFSYSYETERKIYVERLLNYQFTPKERRELRYTLPDFIFTLEMQDVVHYRTAVELELSPKNSKRWKKKLNQYKKDIQDGKYTNVLYVTDNPMVEKRLRVFSQEIGLKIHFATLSAIQEKIGE